MIRNRGRLSLLGCRTYNNICEILIIDSSPTIPFKLAKVKRPPVITVNITWYVEVNPASGELVVLNVRPLRSQ